MPDNKLMVTIWQLCQHLSTGEMPGSKTCSQPWYVSNTPVNKIAHDMTSQTQAIVTSQSVLTCNDFQPIHSVLTLSAGILLQSRNDGA